MKRLRCICILLFLFSLAYAQQAKAVIYHPTLSRVDITYVYN